MSIKLDLAHKRYWARAHAIYVLTGDRVMPFVKRYMELDFGKKMYRNTDNSKVWVEQAVLHGMRPLGVVMPEFKHSGAIFSKDMALTGWYTNDEGESFKDGEGLAWGVVYQLTTKRRQVRFVAGYCMDGWDNLLVDFGNIYTEEAVRDAHHDQQETYDSVRRAARAADRMAELAAEEERDYRSQHREGED